MSDLISRQAAIDALVNSVSKIGLHDNSEVARYGATFRQHEIIDIIEGLPSAELEPHWIPCSERLPEAEKKIYWVCTDGGYQCESRWTNINHFWTELTTDWHWHIMDVPQYSKVVAWMPLPEPYKSESEG